MDKPSQKKKKHKDKTKKFDSIEIDEEMGNDKQNASRPDNVQMEPLTISISDVSF